MAADRGGRPGGGRKASSRSRPRREAPKRTAATDGAPGPSRLLLTRLIRDGSIWNVYIATSSQSGAPNVTELEFEDTGASEGRYSRRVERTLLEALHNGAPVSRSSLQDELELALVAAGSQTVVPARLELSDTDDTAISEAPESDGKASHEA